MSADTLEPDDDAWEMIRNLNTHYGFRAFLLDEIHFLPDPTALLERLYDFLDVRILFSSSVALAMHASDHDLSRRVRLLELHLFSFREFLEFAHGISLPPLSMAEIAGREWEPNHIRAGRFFDAYLRGGLLPFSLEEPEPLGFLKASSKKSSPEIFLRWSDLSSMSSKASGVCCVLSAARR